MRTTAAGASTSNHASGRRNPSQAPMFHVEQLQPYIALSIYGLITMASEILVPRQEPAVHASAPFPTSLRRRGPDGQQDPPHGHHLHRTTSSVTGAAKPCPSPHSHQPPATHGLSSHRSQSAQHSAACRDSTHARDVRPPHITSRESHRRSPSSYGRSPAPRRQPGRALRDLR